MRALGSPCRWAVTARSRHRALEWLCSALEQTARMEAAADRPAVAATANRPKRISRHTQERPKGPSSLTTALTAIAPVGRRRHSGGGPTASGSAHPGYRRRRSHKRSSWPPSRGRRSAPATPRWRRDAPPSFRFRPGAPQMIVRLCANRFTPSPVQALRGCCYERGLQSYLTGVQDTPTDRRQLFGMHAPRIGYTVPPTVV